MEEFKQKTHNCWVGPSKLNSVLAWSLCLLSMSVAQYGMLSPVPLVGQQQQLLFAIEPVTCNPSFFLPVFGVLLIIISRLISQQKCFKTTMYCEYTGC